MSQLVSPAAFPPRLPKKGTIGVVAPSCLTESAWLEAMKRRMEVRGYEVVIHDQCYLKNGALAGSDTARAEAINDMFADGTIDAVFCARGGAGAMQLLDRLDYEMIRANPKPYVGFSDSTAIINTLASHAGIVAYHGPTARSFGADRYTPETEADLFTMIAQGHEGPRCLQMNEAQVARGGQAQGRLVGGNMTLLQALIGTPYDWSVKDGILFIEDVEEPLYKLERVLTQMRLAGKFEGVRAVLVGEMIGILDEKPDLDPKEHTRYGTDFKDIVIKHLPPDVPLAFNVPCGHGRHLATFPVGAEVRVTLGQACGMEVCE